MQIIDFFRSECQKHWLDCIKTCDWGGGQFLYELLTENTFRQMVGEHARLLLLTNGNALVSFCTYAERDDIPTELTPWIGFVYTFPQYRGQRCAGKLFTEIEGLAGAEGVQDIYISTNHIGLYEKYGFTFYRIMTDLGGKPSRVYKKRVE